jgi:S-adenosylmethionine/arginine decarboxylase-like enzyme
MNLLDGPHVSYVDRPGLRGWTGVCIIETSHIAVHVWDEKDPILAQIDVYTCGDMDVDAILETLYRFIPLKVDFIVLDREYAIDELESMTYVYNDGDDEDGEFDNEDLR